MDERTDEATSRQSQVDDDLNMITMTTTITKHDKNVNCEKKKISTIKKKEK